MNFSKMSGYEFEDFIANLLRQKGFKVTQTDYSNDGGVDLIAEYNQPLFSGKYIVQCKKYTDNLVGQPELRDLYGVVMSESANKGILITTSDFTTQAKNFAKGKNLELINGKILNSMIEGENIAVNEPELKFYEMPGFDKKNYEFLKKRLKAGKKNPQNYDNLTTLLESYILNANIEVCKAGLLDEIRNLREEKRINTNKDYVYDPSNEDIDLNELDLCLIEGKLDIVTKKLKELNDFYFSEYPSFLSFYGGRYNIYYNNYSNYYGYELFFNMDFYSKDPFAKHIKRPSFLSSYNYKDIKNIFDVYGRNCIRYDIKDYSLDKWEKIEPIIDKDFTNFYSEDELKRIVDYFERNVEFPENHYFDKYVNNLLEAKQCFFMKIREKINEKFRLMEDFLDKFEPRNLKNVFAFSRIGEVISPLFGYPYKLMLYSAYKKIGFEEGCSEMTKFIKTPKSIDNFSFDFIPEITKILCPDFWNDYHKYVELEIKSYNEFLNGALHNIFNPVWHDKYYKKSDVEIIVEICGENWIIDNYIKWCSEALIQIQKQILKLSAIDKEFKYKMNYISEKIILLSSSIENASNKKNNLEKDNISIDFDFDIEENRLFVAPGFIEMVKCKAETFVMKNLDCKLEQKNNKKLYKATITKPYLIGKYPVTQKLYTRIIKGNLLDIEDFYPSNLVNITWIEAKEFCDLLNKKLKKYLPLSYKFDLPTEAQWEYACKSEKTKEYFIGSGEMLEWCNDWDGDYSSKDVTYPTGATNGEKRVLRGGNWDKESKSWKTLLRDSATPETKSYNVGFRLAIVPIR